MMQIKNLALNIRDFNNRHSKTAEINQFAEEIISIASEFEEEE